MAEAEMMETEAEEEEEVAETSKRSGKRKRGCTDKSYPKVSSSKKNEKENVCFICFAGGNLIPCDHRGCTKAYHPDCVHPKEKINSSKIPWNCAWHICSNCDKSAHYMCYMCTYSLCKGCYKEAGFVCARGNKDFCKSCMKAIILIEKNKQGSKEMVQVDFDDKNSWDYLFKDYWVHLKGKLSFTLDKLTQVRKYSKESGVLAHKEEFPNEIYDVNENRNFKSNSSSGSLELEVSSDEIKNSKGQLNSFKEEDLVSVGQAVSGKGISISNGTEWASKELLEFVAYMKNGDKSVLSKLDLHALLIGYIKQNNLRDPLKRNQILCDSRLVTLFGKAHVKHFEMFRLLDSHLLLKSSKEIYDANDNQNSNSNCSSVNLKSSNSGTEKATGQSNSLKEEDLAIVEKTVSGEGIPISNDTEWASKELLEFVAYMRNGDKSVLSKLDVDSLLIQYITKNNLRNPLKKSQIFCDSRLVTLFGKAHVMHFEMFRLLESHYYVKKDSELDENYRKIGEIGASQLEADSAGEARTKMVTDRRCKACKKGLKRGPQTILDDNYAAINVHNVSLIFLKLALVEDLLEDNDKFQEIIIGSLVRIKIPGWGQKQDLYRLVQVVGAKKVAELYKVCKRKTDVVLEILNLNKREVVSIQEISDQEFTEDECESLRQRIKCGLASQMTVGEIQKKAMALQALRVNDKEILHLCHLRDRAGEKGRKNELRECLKKLQLLNTPEEHSCRLEEIPEVHADPKMDPNYESEDDEEPDDKTRDCYVKTREDEFIWKVRDPTSPGKGSSDSHDAWSGEKENSTTDQEASRNMSTKGMREGDIDSDVGESSWNKGTDAQKSRCEQSPNEAPATGSESGGSNDQAIVTSSSPSVISPESAVPSLPAAAVLSSTISNTKTCHGNEEGSRKHSLRAQYDKELNDKIWQYQDPSGKIQGPYSIVQLRKWCTTGYFPANLRLWRTTENQDRYSILMTDALNGKFLKESPQCLANDGVSQAPCLELTIVSRPNDSSSPKDSLVSDNPTTNVDILTPLTGLVSPIAVKVDVDFLSVSQLDPSTSLHGSSPKADPVRASDLLSSTDARESPLSTMFDDPHGVSQGDALDLPNESRVILPVGVEVDVQNRSSEVSTKIQTLVPEPPALASAETLMHTVVDPVSGINSPSNTVALNGSTWDLSVNNQKPEEDNHVLRSCSTQKLEIVPRPGIASHGWGSVPSQRQEPPSIPTPPFVAQKTEEPDYGYRDDNGPSSLRIHVNNSLIHSRMSPEFNNAVETNPDMQSSVPSIKNLDMRVQDNPNTPDDSYASHIPWGPQQGNADMHWGVSTGAETRGYRTVNQGSIPQGRNMGCRKAPEKNTGPGTMPWGNQMPYGAVPQAEQGSNPQGHHIGWVAKPWENRSSWHEARMQSNNSNWGALAINTGTPSNQQRYNGDRSFGQWGSGSHGGDSGHGGGRVSLNRQSAFGGRGRGGFSGSRPERRVCWHYKRGYCSRGTECNFLHPS